MIKYFTVKNFRSIKNENILEFDAHLENAAYLAHPIIGFAGANASGKTTVLQSLTFVLWFMQHSFLRLDKNDEIPCEPFYST
ncbi:MAG: ATP-binding protein [Pseudomonadota bacterium]